MKSKMLFVLSFMIFLLMLPYAHGPQKIVLSFDGATGDLTVKIIHGVKNAQKHFIEWVKVSVNGEEKIVQFIDFQPDKTGLEMLYRIPDIKPGDKIKVTAKCNKFGKKTAELTYLETKE